MSLVRPARAGDADDVWPLARDFATSSRPRRDSFDETFAALVDREDTLLAVAVAVAEGDRDGGVGGSDGRRGDVRGPAGAVAGYLLASTHLTFLANGSVCWVEEVMVAPPLRRSGVGAALMAYAEQWAHARGAAYVSLASRRAGAFYAALGYDDSATFFRKDLG